MLARLVRKVGSLLHLAATLAVVVVVVVINRPDDPGAGAALRYAYLGLWAAAAVMAAVDRLSPYRLVVPLLLSSGALGGLAGAMWLVSDPWRSWALWLLPPVLAPVLARVYDARHAEQPLLTKRDARGMSTGAR